MSMIGNYMRVSNDELEEFLADSSKLENRVYESEEPDPNLIDVDKAWDAIFYLLTGKTLATSQEAAPPLAWISFPPNEIDPEQDMGYGPACYTTQEQTKELSEALGKINTEQFASSYDGKRMMELGIYPEIWDGDDGLEYVTDYFADLKKFYKIAAANNQAVIIFIN